MTESAIGAISLKQLSPEGVEECGLYVATCGQTGTKQMAFIQELLTQHPKAQLVMAHDGDAAGLRFVINYLVIKPPSENPEKKVIPQEGNGQALSLPNPMFLKVPPVIISFAEYLIQIPNLSSFSLDSITNAF